MTSKEKIGTYFKAEGSPATVPDSHGETDVGRQEEIVFSLRSVIEEKREVIAPGVLAKDEAMGARMEEYEEALELRLSQPDFLILGEDLRRVRLLQDARELVYGEKLKSLDLGVQNLKQEEERLSKQSWEAERAIEHAGRRQAPEPQDFSRILGRIRVRIASSGQEGKLGFIGRVASVFISPSRVHPEIEAYSRRIAATVRELNSQEAQKRQFSDAYIRDKVEVGNHPARIREDVFEGVDDWAVENFDRFLVHALYYPQRRFGLIQSYRRVHSISPRDFKDFEAGLSRYFSLPSEVVRAQSVHSVKDGGDDLQVVEQDVPVEVSTSFAHALLFARGGRLTSAENEAEIQSILHEMFGNKLDVKILRNLVHDLLNLANSRSPLAMPQVKKISGGEGLRLRLGGDYRYSNGQRRIIFDFRKCNGQTQVVVGEIIPKRSDTTYHF